MIISKIDKGNELLKCLADNSYCIYGASILAKSTYKYCFHNGKTNYRCFLVSEKYDNPESLSGQPVQHIEKMKSEVFDCVIVAISKEYLMDVADELKSYNIKHLIILSPFFYDSFSSYNQNHQISEKAFISDDAVIKEDETSSVVVGDGAVIEKNTLIRATKGSSVYIGRGVILRHDIQILVEGSKLYLGDDVNYGKYSILNLSNNGEVTIGKQSTFKAFSYLTCNGSKISIGEDNMFSFYTKVCAGNHKLFDEKSSEDLLNRRPIVLEDHVWVGVGAIILPGAKVGKDSVIGAGSVIGKEIPSNVTCAGIPAHVLREGIIWER